MPITTDSATPASSIALRNASIPAVSWTKLRKWKWPSTIEYFGACANDAAIVERRRAAKREARRREPIGVFSSGWRPRCKPPVQGVAAALSFLRIVILQAQVANAVAYFARLTPDKLRDPVPGLGLQSRAAGPAAVTAHHNHSAMIAVNRLDWLRRWNGMRPLHTNRAGNQ